MKNTFLKQLNHKNHGQVYMHVFYILLMKFLKQQNYIDGIDDLIELDNYDGIVILKSNNDITKTLSQVNSLEITEQDLLRAITQMSCAHQRKITFDTTKLKQLLNNFHKNNWQAIANLQATRPIANQAWSYKSSEISISNKTNSNYQNLNVFYTTESTPTELKPATCEVIFAVKTFISSQMYCDSNFLACYEVANFWAEYQFEKNSDLVGIQQQVCFEKNHSLQISDIEMLILNQLQNLKQSDFIQKLHRKLSSQKPNLDEATMFKASGQVVGHRYWDKISQSQLDSILNQLRIKVEKV